jgi:hypothetical protein
MMRTSELRQRRSSLTVTWDRHVGEAGYPATADASDRSVRPEVASGWARSAWRISPQVTEALLTDEGNAFEASKSSPFYDAVRWTPVSRPPRRGLPLAKHRSLTLSLRAR